MSVATAEANTEAQHFEVKIKQPTVQQFLSSRFCRNLPTVNFEVLKLF